MQLHKLTWSSMSLHAVSWACMQFLSSSEQLTRISQCLFFHHFIVTLGLRACSIVMTIRGISMIRKTEMMMADITEMRWESRLFGFWRNLPLFWHFLFLLNFLFVSSFLFFSASATPRMSLVLRKIRATQGMKWIKMTRNLCYVNVWERVLKESISYWRLLCIRQHVQVSMNKMYEF